MSDKSVYRLLSDGEMIYPHYELWDEDEGWVSCNCDEYEGHEYSTEQHGPVRCIVDPEVPMVETKETLICPCCRRKIQLKIEVCNE